ncbi:NAD(P)H-dependent oxidoreductase [Lapidilactobacillus mulanensis]|uniref:NAD(P)H-dependent oxidoreductase n=1 Tax=Lapidilactobacillus mulanensis TaxID=2485999 RepID=A0ABW4DNB9_9LACO|nr:NADPH-dependent oxidoreductase [Lapidilactobacillus mulanensis]
MKLLGIVGSNADVSYNRFLLQYIQKEYASLFDLEIIEIKDIPMFNQSDDLTDSVMIQNLNRKILQADGVIIATPEHNHTVPAGLKSVLEWLSFKIHPLQDKPVMIVGCSFYDQGTSRAQLHLRQILDAPGVGAITMPGNEFLLGKVKEAFDDLGNLKDEKTRAFLSETLQKFVRFIGVASQLKVPEKLPEEDLHATGKIATTIADVDMHADDWVEQASAKVTPVKGDTYVELDRGILTVDQINGLLKSIPLEITFVDSNNQFLYYNHTADSEKMFAHRKPGQVGNPIGDCHPARAYAHVQAVIAALRSGQTDRVQMPVPTHGPDKYVVHNYAAMHDEDGHYAGVNEYILDIKPIVDFYLKKTGQQLTGGKVDAVSGASQKAAAPQVDAVSGASKKEAAPAPVAPAMPKVDGVSGASKKD